ncbi:hypothetical protein BC940DRAFT_371553 [Gongronella butleri]|nr:hypothetical protein BC940DRAFT_371553 [Gongronella butleri]
MSDQEESLREKERQLFDDSESEISDLDGDQGSGDEAGSVSDKAGDDEPQDEEYAPAADNDDDDTAPVANKSDNGDENASPKAPTLTSTTAQQLPSFKKRVRTEEEQAELEKLREDLRQERQSRQDEDPDNEAPLDPQQVIRNEVAEAFNKALNTGKKRRRKLDGDDVQGSKDEELANLSERMKIAAETDAIANEQRKPAIAKLKMMDEVLVTLNNSSLFDSILDNQLLEAIRVWLEPLPDRALPSLQIQHELLEILDKLPAAAEHLRESGIGKIVLFYKKSPRVEQPVQRKAEHLIAKWTRLVLRRSENYRDRSHQVEEYTEDDRLQPRRKVFRPEDAAKDIDYSRMMVSVPRPVAPDYDIAPRSTVRADRARAGKSQQYKRLKSKMRNLGSGGGQRKKKDD